MIMTVDELRRYVQTDEEDFLLEAQLSALELLIRAYTNNNFQVRAFRCVAVAQADHALLCSGAIPFRVGDTLQITESELMPNQLVTVAGVNENALTVTESLFDESGVVLTKVNYPQDVKLGVARMLQWQLNNGDKVGVQSETISRHSVEYFDMTGDNSSAGFPKSLLGFLRPYKRARFGQGVCI